MTSILPVNCTDLEKKLESLGERYVFDTPIRDLWSAEKCPEELLIYLAWALSVDNWDDNWDIEVKRQVVKNSLDIHRLKGTSKSLADVVGTLGYGILIEYWHQNQEIDKGKFRAIIKASGVPITESTYKEISDVINENKRGTLHLDSFSIATLSIASLKCSSYVKMGETIKIHVRTIEDSKSAASLLVGAGVVIRERLKVLTR